MNRRALASSATALVLMIASARAEPDRHGKTIKQCDEELKAGKAALAASGESASTFIHDCWWHTKTGQPTPIRGSKSPAKPDAAAELDKAKADVAKAQAEAAAAKADAARANEDAAAARKAVETQAAKAAPAAAAPASTIAAPTPTIAPKPASKPARIRPPRVAVPVRDAVRNFARHFVVPRASAPPREAARPRRETERPAEEARVAPIRRPPRGEAPSPLVEMVPVHIVGASRPVPWPVFPEFVPSFRYAVNHPIVPGFTSTP